MVRVSRVLVSVLILAGFLGCSSLAKYNSIQSPPKTFLLSEGISELEDPYFEQIVMAQRTNPNKVEYAKIEYLIERIRHSPLAFIRNGETYAGYTAAQLIDWKYRHRRNEIRNAQDFIQKLATRSSTSGQPYLIQFPNGVTCFACDVLENELHLLESKLHLPFVQEAISHLS